MGKEIIDIALDTVDAAQVTSETASPQRTLRRAYDRVISGIAAGRQEMVFDAFWREGDLALMFGASGTGKSLLAMRIANALASEADIPWFQMDTAAANVLYVDLSMSDRQFAARHSYTGRGGKDVVAKLSRRLFCDRPPDERDLVEWLAERIEAERLKYVIIDDLSAVMNTCDGTRDTLTVMRGLRKLRERFDVSILVVMQSEEPRKGSVLNERDLGRQRSLCRLADSVFGLGRQPGNVDKIYLMQTRSQSSALVWTAKNGIFGTIAESRGTATINFDLRMSDEDAELIRAIHEMHEQGLSYRKVAAELRISKSRAARLAGRWNDLVRIEEEEARDEYDDEYDDEDEYEDDIVVDEGEECEAELDVKPLLTRGLPHSGDGSEAELDGKPLLTRGLPHLAVCGPRACPFMFDGSDEAKRWQKYLFAKFPDRRDVEIVEGYSAGDKWCRPPGSKPPRDPEDPFAGMEVDIDALGNIKYVEERFFNGKPSIYYAYRPDGRLYLFKSDKMTPANANLFGRFATSEEASRKAVKQAKKRLSNSFL